MRWWVLLLCVLGCAVLPTLACPQKCVCRHEQGLYVANCSHLPYNGGKVEVLNLLRSPDDKQMELHDGQFNLAKHLKYLNLRNSSIYFIHKKVFFGTKSLVEIDLSFNRIQEIEPTVFQHLTSLTTLILRGNPIKLQAEVPFLISNSLQHLDIGRCSIRTITRGVFYGLKRLKYLSMDGNLITSLEFNSLPKGLKYLNLSQNLIQDVPIEVLSGLTSLRRLDLSDNPINCTCSLLNFQDYISGRGVVFDEDVTCAVPFEYRGVSLGKIDENKLCLAEAKREDTSHQLLKSRFDIENYLVNDHGFLDEDFQADEPGTLLPDPMSEVLFQNSDTHTMEEMISDDPDEDPVSLGEDSVVESESPSLLENKETVHKDIQETNDNAESQKIEEESKAKHEDSMLNGSLGTRELTHQKPDVDLEVSNDNLNHVTNQNTNDEEIEDNVERKPEDLVQVITAANNTVEKINLLMKDDVIVNNTLNNDNVSNVEPSLPVNQNESHHEEYKPLALDGNKASHVNDELAEEELLPAYINENTTSYNESSEDSTIIPDDFETTDNYLFSTPDPLGGSDLSEANVTSVENETAIVEDSNLTLNVTADDATSTESPMNVTALDNGGSISVEPESTSKSGGEVQLAEDSSEVKDSKEEVTEVVEPAGTKTMKAQTEEIAISEKREPNSSENAALMEKADEQRIGDDEKIKQVAGADVVMFCIAIVVICLVLFSVYKCRRNRTRQSVRTPKDIEANRGTEMQDMTSLLPKPEDDDKKNHKYPDKEPSSETMKLIPETNENESPNIPTVPSIVDKNSINNNSPGSKTPLIKPSHPVTINPAAPIQRTKAKVGIIPDSIPQTPIFLQKTYTNGTKHV